MKLASTFASVASLIGLTLAGCNASDPAVQAEVQQAFTTMCAYLPALSPVIGKMNAQVQADFATGETICAAGAPTNPAVAGMDVLSVYLALAPYFADVRVKATPAMKANVRAVNAELKHRGLM